MLLGLSPPTTLLRWGHLQVLRTSLMVKVACTFSSCIHQAPSANVWRWSRSSTLCRTTIHVGACVLVCVPCVRQVALKPSFPVVHCIKSIFPILPCYLLYQLLQTQLSSCKRARVVAKYLVKARLFEHFQATVCVSTMGYLPHCMRSCQQQSGNMVFLQHVWNILSTE